MLDNELYWILPSPPLQAVGTCPPRGVCGQLGFVCLKPFGHCPPRGVAWQLGVVWISPPPPVPPPPLPYPLSYLPPPNPPINSIIGYGILICSFSSISCTPIFSSLFPFLLHPFLLL